MEGEGLPPASSEDEADSFSADVHTLPPEHLAERSLHYLLAHPASPTDRLCKRQAVPCRFDATGRSESLRGARGQREGLHAALALNDRCITAYSLYRTIRTIERARLRHFR